MARRYRGHTENIIWRQKQASISHHAFDPDWGPTTTGLWFKKYLERFKNYLVAINVKDKARKISLHALCRGKGTRYIRHSLEEMGDDFETAGQKLQENFEPKKHQLYNRYQFRQIVQEQKKKE